ncbi:MAG: hypothetical protein E5V78_34980, partial [Mesorhizobium sp.]
MAAKAIPGKVRRGFPSGIASGPRIILRAALLAAAAFVAAPAFAQTNDPNLTQKQVDCLPLSCGSGSDCDKDGGAKNGEGTPGTASGAVFLPALIVDLFPNPPAGAAPQMPAPSNGASSSNGSGNTPPPAPAPSGPVTV